MALAGSPFRALNRHAVVPLEVAYLYFVARVLGRFVAGAVKDARECSLTAGAAAARHERQLSAVDLLLMYNVPGATEAPAGPEYSCTLELSGALHRLAAVLLERRRRTEGLTVRVMRETSDGDYEELYHISGGHVTAYVVVTEASLPLIEAL